MRAGSEDAVRLKNDAKDASGRKMRHWATMKDAEEGRRERERRRGGGRGGGVTEIEQQQQQRRRERGIGTRTEL